MEKIVIDARFWGPSHTGLGRYTESLVTALYHLKPKFNISLLVLKDRQKELQKTLPRFEIIPVNAVHYTLAEQIEVPRILNQLKPDLVHFLHFNMPIFYRKPFIVTIHDLIKHHSSGLKTTTKFPLFYPIKRWGYKIVIQQAVKRAQLILTPSKWVKNDITKYYQIASNKILVTPEAAERSFFQPIKPGIKDIILNQPYLVYAGNAYPHKNIIQLIKAIRLYNLTFHQDLKLVIITNKDVFYQRLRQQIHQFDALNTVRIKGFTDDEQLKNLYYHAHGFITASLFEGFGLPGLEAMAAQTLVLSSNQACLPEVYGKHAFYFDPNDLDSMVKVIAKTFKLKNRTVWLNESQIYAKSFSWEKTAELTLAAYRKLL